MYLNTFGGCYFLIFTCYEIFIDTNTNVKVNQAHLTFVWSKCHKHKHKCKGKSSTFNFCLVKMFNNLWVIDGPSKNKIKRSAFNMIAVGSICHISKHVPSWCCTECESNDVYLFQSCLYTVCIYTKVEDYWC